MRTMDRVWFNIDTEDVLAKGKIDHLNQNNLFSCNDLKVVFFLMNMNSEKRIKACLLLIKSLIKITINLFSNLLARYDN